MAEAIDGAKDTAWSDINKVRFYGIGTCMYTTITMALHPISVIKTRQQILNNAAKEITIPNGFDRIRGLYRGLGIILVVAIPARGVYIGTLENSREIISNKLFKLPFFNECNQDGKVIGNPFVASISGGIAGGLASMSSQTLIVPMDVISQRQMVMKDAAYARKGTAFCIISDIIRSDGYKGFYRGFGLSLFSSLPVGSIWWGTYTGCQHLLQNTNIFRFYKDHNDMTALGVRGCIQLISGLSAAAVAATLTQPLDVIKTRLQVGVKNSMANVPHQPTYFVVAKELYNSSGSMGFFRGTGPRIMSMGLWGTVLSSAYEYLRIISRKDYELHFDPLSYWKLKMH